MGKRIRSRRRGRGTHVWRALSHRFKADAKHPSPGAPLQGTVVSVEHDPARFSPVAKVVLDGGGTLFTLAREGLAVGDRLSWGGAAAAPGSTLELGAIEDGTEVFNVELRPGDGGRFARTSGSRALVVSHEAGKVAVQLPSGTIHWLPSRARATIGIVAGGGRTDKPLLKAGAGFFRNKTKGHSLWPRVRSEAMRAVDHPFGGGRHQHVGRPKTVSRGAPPGRKVGSIAARRGGKR
jgi:large subunit ribosomal protein L2